MLFRLRQPHPIEAEIPRLRRFALALTRDRAAADDLVPDCLARALAAWATRREADALHASLFAILHHLSLSRLLPALNRPDRFGFEHHAAARTTERHVGKQYVRSGRPR